jgi:uncharacterized protein YdeI (BOF family)
MRIWKGLLILGLSVTLLAGCKSGLDKATGAIGDTLSKATKKARLISVEETAQLKADDLSLFALEGLVTKDLGDGTYSFADSTGEITILASDGKLPFGTQIRVVGTLGDAFEVESWETY